MNNFLVTGPPGSGKTTLIVKVAGELAELGPTGFYTREIREGGARKGFELVSLDGDTRTLSHENIKGPHRVGRYGVDVTGFEGFLSSIDLSAGTGPVVIDEIGKMECFSGRFVELVRGLLESGRVVLATVAMKGGGFMEETRSRRDARLFTVTPADRDGLVREIAGAIRRACEAG